MGEREMEIHRYPSPTLPHSHSPTHSLTSPTGSITTAVP